MRQHGSVARRAVTSIARRQKGDAERRLLSLLFWLGNLRDLLHGNSADLWLHRSPKGAHLCRFSFSAPPYPIGYCNGRHLDG
jgi:hypothetical protein